MSHYYSDLKTREIKGQQPWRLWRYMLSMNQEQHLIERNTYHNEVEFIQIYNYHMQSITAVKYTNRMKDGAQTLI